MKKIGLLILTTFLMATTLSAQLKVLASASMWYDMAQEIGGEHVDVELLVPVGGDPHMYEPVTQDAVKVSNADMILVNGLTFEGWIDDLIANSGTQAKTYTISKYIKPITSDVYAGATDPHAWMSAENGAEYCRAIYEALAEMDPEHADDYKANYEKYREEILAMHTFIKVSIQSIPQEHRVLITSHDAFKYYGETYGLKLESIQGMSTDAEAQKSDMVRVSDAIKKYGVPAVFIESTINPKMIAQVAEDNGAVVGGELFADSLGDPEDDSGTYLGMMRYNTDVIVNALSGKQDHSHVKLDNEATPWYLYAILIGVLVLVLGLTMAKLK